MPKRFPLLLLTLLSVSSLFAAYTDIKVTEIMYNAPANGLTPGNAYEFIELKNTGTASVNLTGLNFSIGILWSAPTNFTLAPGAFAVLVSDPVQFAVKYPAIPIAGTYLGSLSNAGEQLKASVGIDTFIAIKYNDNNPWPVLADGNGFSLVPTLINPTGSQNKASLWRNSANIGGSPGSDDPTPPVFPDVYINEVMTNPALPGVDSIEIVNNSSSSVDISDWWLTDNKNLPQKYKMPNGSIIPAGGYLVLNENQFGTGLNAFGLSSAGEMVFLFSADVSENLTGFSTGWNFDGQYLNTAFGVHTNSLGKRLFVAMSHPSMGRANPAPRIGPLVIDRFNYFPDLSGDEFLSIRNISDSVVHLYSATYLDSTWEIGGISFAFPPGVSINPNEVVIITKSLPSQFRSKYSVPAATKIYQCSGSLNNQGETITIRAIGNLYTNALGPYMSRIIIDQVKYNDKAPWPLSCVGGGDYLKRKVLNDFGNDVANWMAANGSIVGVKPLEISAIDMGPNPTHGFIHINGVDVINLSLFDLSGHQLQSYDVSNSNTIDLHGLATGLYIYQIQTISGKYTGKLIKQ